MDEEAGILTSYFRERHHAGAKSPSEALVSRYEHSPAAAASILLRSFEGYGPGQEPGGHRAFAPAEGPLVTAVAVGPRPGIESLLGEGTELVQPQLVTLGQAHLLTEDIDPVWLGESAGEATALTIYCQPGTVVFQVPAFEEACALLHRRGVAGATVLSGADGTFGSQRLKTHFLRHGTDALLTVTAVGSGDQIAMILPELGDLFRHPLMTLTTIRLCKRDGQLISRPEKLPDDGASAGMTPQVKLTIYTSEAARYEGQPAHRAIVRGLRSAGIACAFSQRGIWGYHGDRLPHGGDHFPLSSRHVPIVTTVIDTPDRIAAAFDIIDPLTAERGLVTAEMVLALQPARVSQH